MAILAAGILVTDLLSGDGPDDIGYPRWSLKYDRIMRNEYDTPEYRAMMARYKKAFGGSQWRT